MLIIPIEISARHVHLSRRDLDTLFGEGYELTPIKELSQRGQFAAKELVEVQTPSSWGLQPHRDFTFGKAPDHNQMRILGPVRDHTQVELSWSDCIVAGVEPKVLISGNLKNSAGGLILIGPKGEVKLNRGIIVPQRHIHCDLGKAEEFGFKNGQIVSVQVLDQDKERAMPRQITFHNVVLRVHRTFDLEMHLDTDEGNAAGILGSGKGMILP